MSAPLLLLSARQVCDGACEDPQKVPHAICKAAKIVTACTCLSASLFLLVTLAFSESLSAPIQLKTPSPIFLAARARTAGTDDEYYRALEVPRTASEAEIKKAYRKAAIKWHPDKNPNNKQHAEQMFKSVAEAYEVLSDPNKRSTYDRFGKDGLEGGMGGFGGFSDIDPFQIFNQFFGGKDPFAQFFGEESGSPGGSVFSSMFGGGGGDFFGGGGGSVSSFSSFSSMGGGAMGTSTSTRTSIVNGKRVTVTEKTVHKPDGTVETTRTESDGSGPPRITTSSSSGGSGRNQITRGGGGFGGFRGLDFGDGDDDSDEGFGMLGWR
eukprot:gnl/MRDRNA2_/MRDRNA2_93310_c0_seq1.p1 gnl/MRDRNA2_/MRDRNA2_93310_c0~~gnl/MRDRNA2_/MRDRNA2_93310_c0_seq1.p1  ORF type:complete len:323 (+),score=52.80 gnl/MRDRNA2_/MRDRNA2_93310_c0_seq1:63-1031(+)